MNEAYLILGGNLGNRTNNLAKAEHEIEKNTAIIEISSSVYETEAWGNKQQPSFLNKVIKVKTHLTAKNLLTAVLHIEELMGRIRSIKYGPRIIDIDILFFNNDIINEEGIHIPHPEIQNRRFVLTPLNEIAPDLLHPVFQLTTHQLLELCTDELRVNKIN